MFALRSHGVRQLSRFRFLQYSTSATANPIGKNHFMVDCFINSFGLSRDEAISASRKVTHLKSTKQPNLLLNLFKQYDLDETQIKNILYFVPRILLHNVDKTLAPKLRVFQDLGLSRPDLTRLITKNRSIFHSGLDTHIIPTIEYLRELLGSDEKVVKTINNANWSLSYAMPNKMPHNVLLLQDYGLSNEKIGKLIVQKPNYFMYKPEWLKDRLQSVEVELGIPRESGMFFYAFYVLASLSKSTKEMKFGIFRSFGWSNSEIVTMLKRQPFCLGLSEAKIRSKLNFFMIELGYTPAYLAAHPALLTFSLDKRVIPRYQVLKILKEKKQVKRELCLYSVVSMTELKFGKDVVLRHTDVIPELYETYTNNKGQQQKIK